MSLGDGDDELDQLWWLLRYEAVVAAMLEITSSINGSTQNSTVEPYRENGLIQVDQWEPMTFR
jgi:hypothetical protein